MASECPGNEQSAGEPLSKGLASTYQPKYDGTVQGVRETGTKTGPSALGEDRAGGETKGSLIETAGLT